MAVDPWSPRSIYGPFTYDYEARSKAALLVQIILWIKDIVAAVTLLPLRIILIPFIVISLFIQFKLLEACYGKYSPKAQKVVAWHTRIIMFVVGIYYIKETGSPEEQEAKIFLSNHISYLDILVFVAKHRAGFISKASIKKIPIVGTMAESFGSIFVDRLTKEGGESTVSLLSKRLSDDRASSRPIVVFPEGTTTNGRFLLAFKTGAFVPGVSVQPCVLRYPYHFHSPSASVVRHSLLFFRLLTQLYIQMEIEYLPVYKPSEEEKNNPKVFAENVQKVMASKLGVNISSQTYTDKFRLMQRMGLKKQDSETSSMARLTANDVSRRSERSSGRRRS